MHKKIQPAYCAILIVIVLFGLAPGNIQSVDAASYGIVISQVYGGGGDSEATFKNDFIELFNRGTSPVDITGWSVQYASDTGSSWDKTNLSGSLQPGQYFLIEEAAGGGGTQNLPTPDVSGNINLHATNGKVALVTNQTLLTCGAGTNDCFPNGAIKDLIGYGTANNYEGSGPVNALSNTTAAQRAERGCIDADNSRDETIFDNGVWWIARVGDFSIEAPKPRNGTFPSIACQNEMDIYINGAPKDKTYLLRFGHKNGNQWPEVSAIYNSGYIRLAPFGLPFGTSFILGPAYWESNGGTETYVHNIQISRIDIDTSGVAPTGSLRLVMQARDYHASRWPGYRLNITYSIILPAPVTGVTQMQVTENYSVANSFLLSATRQLNHEGFKWVQFSSMYVDGIYHDSDSAQYLDQNEIGRNSTFADTGCDSSIFTNPQPLSSSLPWVLVRHGNDESWQGNTPNTIIQLDNIALGAQTVPQGYITCSTDPNDDNVGVWLNRETASSYFQAGNTGSVKYTLIAQDNPAILKTFKSISTQDGWILESAENSNAGGTLNSTATTLRLGDNAARKQYRAILSFSTGAGLPDNAVVTKVTLKVKQQGILGGGNPVTTFQGFMVDIRKGFFGTTALQTSDFQTAANKSYGPFKPTLVSNWYNINLTSAKAYINKLTTSSGLTQIRLRFKLDDNNNAVANFLSLYSGNTGATNRPTLIIEYYVP